MRYRCLNHSQLLEFGCHPDHIYENEPKLHILEDSDVHDYVSTNSQAIQVQPQRVYLKLVNCKFFIRTHAIDRSMNAYYICYFDCKIYRRSLKCIHS